MRRRPLLPHDLFHSHIIPDILSDHLHQLFVGEQPPSWHAFHTLPLVSPDFRRSCQSLSVAIFGQESCNENSLYDVVNSVQSLWIQAKLPPKQAAPPYHYSFRELMSQKSLIRVYMCIALAQSYLKHDVLYPLDCQRAASELGSDGHGAVGDHAPSAELIPPGRGTRRYRMRDDNMHRVYLPLTCAVNLCDTIVPARLAYKVSEHLADIIPMFTTLPVMLKYTQDLEIYVLRCHRVPTETYVDWTLQTLSLVSQCEDLLKEMQAMGHAVHSFTRTSVIPSEVIVATNITQSLHDVIDADWGMDSDEIRGRATIILQQWSDIQ